jgi:hypothetical protein
MDSGKSQQQSVSALSAHNPDGWLGEVMALFERAITTEYASLTAKVAPLTYPVTPYISEDGQTLDVSTGLTYPSKAERARRNPKVALLYSDPVGSGLSNPPIVLVQGLAAVRDADLQANTDRYLRQSFAKVPEAYAGTPAFMMRRMPWYFVRIWVQVTPLRILWCPEGNLDRPPERWEASVDIKAPESDPGPKGKPPGSWKAGPADWQTGAGYAVQHMGDPVVTLVDGGGFPFPTRVKGTRQTPTGFQFDLPAGYTTDLFGPACLTFHTHPEQFTSQQNMVFTGRVEAGGKFVVDRQVGDWSLPKSKLMATLTFMNNGRKLAPRLMEEAQRRGQSVPVINIP